MPVDEDLALPVPDGDDSDLPLDVDPALAPLPTGDAGLDDAEQGGSLADLVRELDVGEEAPLLEGSEAAEEIPAGDVLDHEPSASLLGDDDAPGVDGEDFGLGSDAGAPAEVDAGEEGFEDDEPHLTDALPAMDADDDGELEDDLGFEPAAEQLPPWDDRGWERAAGPLPVGAVTELWLEGGAIAALVDPGGLVVVDPSGAVLRRDTAPAVPPERPRRRAPVLEGATAEVTWGRGAVAALHSEAQERTWLVRVGADGARIVADVTDDAGDQEGPAAALVVEPTRGWVWVGGRFGLLAYRPPKRRD